MQKINVFFPLRLLPLFVLFFVLPLSLGIPTGKTISLDSGKELFQKNCSVCHLGGNNIIIPEKNLKKESLEENGMKSTTAISYQILNGKNGMPAFGGRLTKSEIDAIAQYVSEAASTDFRE